MHIFYLGVILLVGYGLSVLAAKAGFPKIVGYLIAGLLLNPELVTFIPTDFLDITEPVTTFCLAFITFEIGSSFSIEELKTPAGNISVWLHSSRWVHFFFCLLCFLF